MHASSSVITMLAARVQLVICVCLLLLLVGRCRRASALASFSGDNQQRRRPTPSDNSFDNVNYNYNSYNSPLNNNNNNSNQPMADGRSSYNNNYFENRSSNNNSGSGYKNLNSEYRMDGNGGYIPDNDNNNNRNRPIDLVPVPPPMPPPPPGDAEAAILETRRRFAAFACNALVPAARAELLPRFRRRSSSRLDDLDRGRGSLINSNNGRRRSSSVATTTTAADRSAEWAMRNLIERQFPEHGIVGGQFGSIRAALDDNYYSAADYVWCLDVLGGAAAQFVAGQPTFGTAIGLCHRGRPVVGVLDFPALREQWVGVAGDDCAWLNGAPVRVAASSSSIGAATKLEDAVVLLCGAADSFSPRERGGASFGNSNGGFESVRLQSLRDRARVSLCGTDGAYAYALVASGFGADLAVGAGLDGPQEYAAVVPVVQSAGGVITDWNGEELTLRQRWRRGESSSSSRSIRVVAAANPALHGQALRLLRERRLVTLSVRYIAGTVSAIVAASLLLFLLWLL